MNKYTNIQIYKYIFCFAPVKDMYTVFFAHPVLFIFYLRFFNPVCGGILPT